MTYIAVARVLRSSWESVEITFCPEETGPRIFFVRCQHSIESSYDAEEASLRLARSPLVAQKEYNNMIKGGCSLTNLQDFLQVINNMINTAVDPKQKNRVVQSMDPVAVLRFLHFFLSTAFHQLTTTKQAQRFLAGVKDTSSEVYCLLFSPSDFPPISCDNLGS